jgi:hypothetical protein
VGSAIAADAIATETETMSGIGQRLRGGKGPPRSTYRRYLISVSPPGFARAVFAAALAISAHGASHAAPADRPDVVRPSNAVQDRVLAEREIVIVRLDPKGGARPGECDDLKRSDLDARLDKQPVEVVAVERVPRPERHWLLLDISESAEGRREEAMRSALQYVQQVMSPGEDVVALVTVDEDPILVAGPTTDPRELADKIDDVQAGGWSALRDGLDTVLRQIQGDRHEHVVLYWTDGEDQASALRAEDLLATLARAPNATVFPISLLPRGAKFPPPPLVGAVFTEVARASGGEVFVSSDPSWLDRVRGWLGRRFTVSLDVPTGRDAGRASKRRLALTTPGKRCKVSYLPDPFAGPDPVAGEAMPTADTWRRLHEKSREADDPACLAPNGKASWDWPLNVTGTGLSGCVLDVVRSSGPIVRERNRSLSYKFQSPRFAARDIRVAAPPLASLPTDAADAVASIVPADGEEGPTTSPYFMEGGALLAMRAQIAASLFAGRSDYHDFAVARLARLAADDLRAIEADFARMFPDLPRNQIAAIARASRAGARSLASATTPTDSDMARVLAAWIADVQAAELLRRIEAREIDARLAGRSVRAAENRWSAVRARFAIPSRVRIVAPLALIHDPSQDVVGFARIVLPRPEGFRKPDPRPPAQRPRDNDRIIGRPLALGLVDDVAADPEIGKALSDGGYRVVSIEYGELDPPFKHEPNQPFERARVTVRLAAPATGGGDGRHVGLEADVTASMDGPVVVTQFTPTVVGDPELAALLTRYRARPRRTNRPSRAPCCGRRRGSSRARAERG